MTNQTFEVTTWGAVKEKALQLNPLIANEINKIPKVNQFKVVIARYRFGDPVIDKGQFNVRLGRGVVPFCSNEISKEIKEMMESEFADMLAYLLLFAEDEKINPKKALDKKWFKYLKK